MEMNFYQKLKNILKTEEHIDKLVLISLRKVSNHYLKKDQERKLVNFKWFEDKCNYSPAEDPQLPLKKENLSAL